jgi:hypothetical protein
MLSDKYLLAGSRTYPGPQGVHANPVPGAGDTSILGVDWLGRLLKEVSVGGGGGHERKNG